MQALTYCDAIVMSTRTTVGQFKGQFKGAMDESSGKGSKMQAHISSGATALQAKKWSA